MKDIILLSHCKLWPRHCIINWHKVFFKLYKLGIFNYFRWRWSTLIKDICLMLDLIENNNYDAVLGSRFLNKEYLSKVPLKENFTASC